MRDGPVPQSALTRRPAPKVRAAIPDDPKLAEQARTRAAAVREFLEVRHLGHAVQLADNIARRYGLDSGRTIRRWTKRWIEALKDGQNPEAALCDRVRKDRGTVRKLTPEHCLFLEKKFLAERISNYQLVYEALRRQFPDLAVHPDTVRRYLNGVAVGLKTLAHKGPRALASTVLPNIVRDMKEPMDWWVLDHRELDVGCRNTIFSELAPGRMYRPWITAIGDWGSRAWVGFCFSPGPSWQTIGSALRMALREFGFPRNFYWDNGEDFKKAQRMIQGYDLGESFGSALQNFLKDNGAEFGVTRAQAYNPQAKPIESWFAGMSKRHDLIWGAAYQGNTVHHRSEWNARAQKAHSRFLLGKRGDSPLPADVEVIAGCIAWMQRENIRPRRVLGGRTPFDMLCQECPTPLRPAGRNLLNLLFSERDRRTVQRGGCVQLDRRKYEPTDESLGPLSIAQGHEVIVLRDPYALESAVALEPETMAFIGELRLQEFVAQCPNGHITRDQIQAHARKVSHLRKMYSGYLSWLAAVGEVWKSERGVLLEEAGFATGAEGRALPAAAIPGARAARVLPAASSQQARVVDSPFNDDAAAIFNAAMAEDATK